MLWLQVIILQVALLLAPNPSLYQRKNHFNRFSRYSPHKRQETALSIYPRCRSDPTVLDIIVVDKSGKPAGRSKLWISTSTGMREFWTSKKGDVRLTVTGCQVGIVVWAKEKMAKHQNVNLWTTEDKLQKVVIQLDRTCNFLVKFHRSRSRESNRISYTATSGGRSTTGIVAGGLSASPVCIDVKNGDSLYMVMEVQSNNYPNILYMSDVKEGTDALVRVRYPQTTTSGDLSIKYTLNVWKYSLSTGIGDTVLGVVELHEGPVQNKGRVYLVSASFLRSEKNLKGNVVLYDAKRNLRIVEVPRQTYTDSTKAWILGCFKGCLDTFKEKSEFVEDLPDTEDEIKEYCNMN